MYLNFISLPNPEMLQVMGYKDEVILHGQYQSLTEETPT